MAHDTQTAHHGPAFRHARAIWRRRKWVVMLAFIAPFSAAVSLIVAMPNLYRAKATVLVEQVPEITGRPYAAGSSESRLEMIGQEVMSRARLEDLIARFNLYPELRRRDSPQAVVDRMRKDIRFQRKDVEMPWGRGVTVAFTLGYQGWDPQTVAQVTNALVSLYVEENEKLRRRPGGMSVSSGTDGNAVNKLVELKRQLAEARARFNDSYPDVMRIKAEIAALEQEWQAGGQTSAVVASPSVPDPALDIDGGRFRIIDPALPPAEPIAPNRIRLVFIALILSLGAAGAAAILAEQMDTSYHRLDQLWYHVRMPILAGIPRIVTHADTWRRRLRLGFTGILVVAGLALLIQASYFLGQSAEQLIWMLAQRAT